jgi:hypothetical protein
MLRARFWDEIELLFGEVGSGSDPGLDNEGVSFWGDGNGQATEVGGGFGDGQAFGLEEIQDGFALKFQFGGSLGLDGSEGI